MAPDREFEEEFEQLPRCLPVSWLRVVKNPYRRAYNPPT
jgi:hypothetical protein